MFIERLPAPRRAALLLLLVTFAAPILITATVAAQTDTGAVQVNPEMAKWAFLSAALVTGASCIGAGVAVAYVGAAAVAALAEKPQLAGRALIFVGLAEGIAIYGLIIAIMILGKV
ncbi:MAG: H+transporting two-sector ATPase C subunit [Candidatus Hydrogenedentes bacterium]|nr:H+transporting two-sector ATPase C subunit [Candidatus Hydrogenedentota bacterium]